VNHAGPGASTITWLIGGSIQSHEGEGNNFITSLDQAFDQALLLGSRWGWGEQASILVGAISDMRYNSVLGRLSSEFKLRDGLLFALSVDILDGPPESPIGAYRNNDRAGMQFTWLL
jgi:hypothetical protein